MRFSPCDSAQKPATSGKITSGCGGDRDSPRAAEKRDLRTSPEMTATREGDNSARAAQNKKPARCQKITASRGEDSRAQYRGRVKHNRTLPPATRAGDHTKDFVCGNPQTASRALLTASAGALPAADRGEARGNAEEKPDFRDHRPPSRPAAQAKPRRNTRPNHADRPCNQPGPALMFRPGALLFSNLRPTDAPDLPARADCSPRTTATGTNWQTDRRTAGKEVERP